MVFAILWCLLFYGVCYFMVFFYFIVFDILWCLLFYDVCYLNNNLCYIFQIVYGSDL